MIADSSRLVDYYKYKCQHLAPIHPRKKILSVDEQYTPVNDPK
jgi:hypothetical protein